MSSLGFVVLPLKVPGLVESPTYFGMTLTTRDFHLMDIIIFTNLGVTFSKDVNVSERF